MLSLSSSCTTCNDELFIKGEEGGFRFCQCIETIRQDSLWRNYNYPKGSLKKINDYEGYDSLTKSLKYMANNYAMNFEEVYKALKRDCSFGIFGQSGAGKTHISTSIGGAAISMGYKAVYMPYIPSMTLLRTNIKDHEAFLFAQNNFKLCDLLIIDDLFKNRIKNGKVVEAIDRWERELIFSIIDYRYSHFLPTIFISEASVEGIISIDEGVGGRIVEMCGGNIIYLGGERYNYRLR